jgi:hypothetical protein
MLETYLALILCITLTASATFSPNAFYTVRNVTIAPSSLYRYLPPSSLLHQLTPAPFNIVYRCSILHCSVAVIAIPFVSDIAVRRHSVGGTSSPFPPSPRSSILRYGVNTNPHRYIE